MKGRLRSRAGQKEPEVAAKHVLQWPTGLVKELGIAGNVSFDNSS